MGWSDRFLGLLVTQPARPVWVLETVRLSSSNVLTGQWRIASHAGFGCSPILAGGPRASMAEVALGSWSYTAGAWSVGVAGDDTDLVRKFQRGQVVRLLMGGVGWAYEDLEQVALGQVWSYSGPPGRRVLQMRDLVQALVSRLTTDADRASLFSALGTSTTLSSSYAAGDATLTASSVANFDRQGGPSGSLKGMVRITPKSGAAAFYLTYTGTSGSQFTGVSSTGQLSTTAVAAGSGSTVEEIAYLDDHPVDAALRILLSTGAYAATGYDTLPATWGYGLPVDLVDTEDAARTKMLTTPASGSAEWDIAADEAQPDALSWLAGVLAPGGLWVGVRQGRLTVRAAQHPRTVARWSGVRITDSDIVSVDDWQAWDPTIAREAYRHRLRTGDGTSASNTDAVGTLPAVDTWEAVLAHVHRDVSAWRNEVAGRVRDAILTPWEVVDLTLRGWRCAALAQGDTVEIDSDHITGRDGKAYDGRRALVLGGPAPDWMGATTRIRVGVPPTWAGVLP